MKNAIKRAITGSRTFLRLLDRFVPDMPRVLVYHRFTPPGVRRPHRVSADELSWQLDVICRDFKVVSLDECVEYFLFHGAWPKASVILTVDDGYRDMYEWAYPELLKRNLKATFFVTTRFIDGDIWLWPDRLEYAIANTAHKKATISMGDSVLDFPLHDDKHKAAAWKALSDYCISISSQRKDEFQKKVESILDVSLPSAPPLEYAASTWDEIREMGQNGIEIGSHTKNHPILSKVNPSLLDSEVGASKHVIEQQIGHGIKSFCYPNSAPDDINEDVIAAVRKAGFKCAVFGRNLSSWEPYTIPRMGVTDDRNDFLWKIHSGESISIVRRGNAK